MSTMRKSKMEWRKISYKKHRIALVNNKSVQLNDTTAGLLVSYTIPEFPHPVVLKPECLIFSMFPKFSFLKSRF